MNNEMNPTISVVNHFTPQFLELEYKNIYLSFLKIHYQSNINYVSSDAIKHKAK